ncbi:MAG: hypothetical protein VKL01_02380 [Limnothrix sp.]|uniref:hypothetical protein n=1 Tax=unclassified Limnothrix TaxID=2632864 RepID=UPI001680D972|nr:MULTISPECIES: hypothetical protein [unclassified Limnothrix]MBD2162281.1 hypothetical protein [Limnothrix sp. FACHB-1083]MBD2193304.1 hypothetical protein [Limnothrix sp. FACHB-1088]MEB3117187.1 hypothetical protein [Limnothrix sp.]
MGPPNPNRSIGEYILAQVLAQVLAQAPDSTQRHTPRESVGELGDRDETFQLRQP